MINTRQLTRPSPSDANLRITGDPLGMLCEGSYDRNRYGYYHNSPKQLNNRTNDIFLRDDTFPRHFLRDDTFPRHFL